MGEWQHVAVFDELPDGNGSLVIVNGERVALFRIGDEVLAIGDRCSHAEASLAEGEVFDREVECPRHGSTFDIDTGHPLTLPATQPVPVYQVKLEDGNVFLMVDEA